MEERRLFVRQEDFEGLCCTITLRNVFNAGDTGKTNFILGISVFLVDCLDSQIIMMLTEECRIARPQGVGTLMRPPQKRRNCQGI